MTAAEIYSVYPRKVSKPKALKAIEKVLAKPPSEFTPDEWSLRVFTLTQAYAAARKGEDPEFTPHPSTFFNGRRFEDDPSTWGSVKTTAHAPDPSSPYGF